MSTVRIESPAEGVAHLIIDRPEKRNALDGATVAELMHKAAELSCDHSIRVVVLRSTGDRAFSAGADLNDLAALDGTTAHQFIANLHRAIAAVRHIPVPVICRVQGTCVGGAMELAAGCDLRIASRNATFAMPEVRVGIPSVIEAALLPRLMGRGRAGWLVLSGEAIDAETACRWGFIEYAVEPDDLDAAVERAVAAVLIADPDAVRAQKRLLQDWEDVPLNDAIQRSMDAFASCYACGRPTEIIREIQARREK